MRALLSGSHKYGTPHENSDVDLVVYMSPEDAHVLCANADSCVRHNPTYSSCRYGKLNLMVCTDLKYYGTWESGLAVLTLRKLTENQPITRKQAIEVFSNERAVAGVGSLYPGDDVADEDV